MRISQTPEQPLSYPECRRQRTRVLAQTSYVSCRGKFDKNNTLRTLYILPLRHTDSGSALLEGNAANQPHWNRVSSQIPGRGAQKLQNSPEAPWEPFLPRCCKGKQGERQEWGWTAVVRLNIYFSYIHKNLHKSIETQKGIRLESNTEMKCTRQMSRQTKRSWKYFTSDWKTNSSTVLFK